MLHKASIGPVLFFALYGCTHTKADDNQAVPPVAELGIVDPDPSRDKGPEFCNPSGRLGDDLKRCHQQNESLYKEFAEEAKRREPWFNFAGDGWLQSQELDGKFVVPVVSESLAIAKLEKAQIIELNDKEAEAFTGKTAQIAGRKPYLIRALMYYKENGHFAVFEKGQEIFVRHDSTGAATQHEQRTALVVYLTFKPTNVFIDCQIVEGI
jgi:hypothetical protein